MSIYELVGIIVILYFLGRFPILQNCSNSKINELGSTEIEGVISMKGWVERQSYRGRVSILVEGLFVKWILLEACHYMEDFRKVRGVKEKVLAFLSTSTALNLPDGLHSFDLAFTWIFPSGHQCIIRIYKPLVALAFTFDTPPHTLTPTQTRTRRHTEKRCW